MHGGDCFRKWFKFIRNLFSVHFVGAKDTNYASFAKITFYKVLLLFCCHIEYRSRTTLACFPNEVGLYQCYWADFNKRYIAYFCLGHYYTLEQLLLIYFEHYLQNFEKKVLHFIHFSSSIFFIGSFSDSLI